MAKLAVTVTVFFLILASSDAFSVSTGPENDIVNDLTTDLPEPDLKTTTSSLAVPGDKNRQPDSEPETVVVLESEIYGSGSRSADPRDENRQPGSAIPGDENRQPGSEPGTVFESESKFYGSGSRSEIPEIASLSSEKEDTPEVTLPTLTFVNFRPINRHFPRRPLTASRFHHRPCRFYHRRYHHRQYDPFGPRLEIPYGQGMILSGGEEERGFDSDPALRGVPQHIPATWMRTHEEDGEREREIVKKITMTKRRHHHHHDHGHDEEDHEKDENKDKGEDHKEYKDRFMKKVRKFLKHQF